MNAAAGGRAASIAILIGLCAWLALIPLAPVPARAQSSAGLDVVLVIDNSGSMLSNDPAGLRWSAAHLFVDLSSPGDRLAGIWFANNARPLGDEALSAVQNEASRQALKDSLRSIQPNPQGSTNMEEAMRLAFSLLDAGGNRVGGNRPVIVFLTDGKPTPDSQRPALRRLIDQSGQSGIAIFPILLGRDTDVKLGRDMADRTGGLLQQVRDASGLLRAFGKIYSYLRPELYLDELSLSGGGSAFRTNPAQALVEMVVVAPRRDKNAAAISSLALGGAPLQGGEQLPNGAQVSQAESEHYQLRRVAHNTPITGEWLLSAPGDGAAAALLVARSAVTLDLQYPVSSVTGSFVAPRRVPAGKPVLLIAAVLQDARPLGDVPLAVTASGGTSLALNATGLSPNRELAWQFLDLGSFPTGEQQQIEMQIGAEFSPFRMRKELVLEAIQAPHLVVDSPTPTDSGLIAGGKLRIAAHFDGPGVSTPSVQAYVYDPQNEAVESLALECESGACKNETFLPQPGRSYQILLAGTAIFQGLPYSDGARTELATGDLIRVDGLERLTQPLPLLPGAGLPAIPITVTAYLQSGQPQLNIRLESLHPVPPGLSSDSAAVGLTSLVPRGSNTYVGALQFTGFNRLPPGEYSAQLQIQAIGAGGTGSTGISGEVKVIPSSVAFQVRIAQPVARFLDLPNPLDLGQLPGLQEPRLVTATMDFGGQPPFDLTGVVSELRSNLGAENTQLLQLDLGRPAQGQIVLRFSALQTLHPGAYNALIQFQPADASNPTRIEPAQSSLAFTIPQPGLQVQQVSEPARLAACPRRSQKGSQNDRLAFGAFTSYDQNSELTVVFDGSWLSSPPDVNVEITQLHRQGSPDLAITPVRLTPGTIHAASQGAYALPLLLELPDGLRSGEYLGEVRLSSTQAAVQPERLTMNFFVRTNLFGRLRQVVLPGYCTMMGLYIWPPSLLIGLRNWGFTLLGLVIVGSTLQHLFGAQGQGTLYMKGENVVFTDRRPAYVVWRESGPRLSCQPADAANSLAEVRIERDPHHNLSRARLRSGSRLAGSGMGLGVWSDRGKRYVRLSEQGALLNNKGRFLLASKRVRYEFSMSIDG